MPNPISIFATPDAGFLVLSLLSKRYGLVISKLGLVSIAIKRMKTTLAAMQNRQTYQFATKGVAFECNAAYKPLTP